MTFAACREPAESQETLLKRPFWTGHGADMSTRSYLATNAHIAARKYFTRRHSLILHRARPKATSSAYSSRPALVFWRPLACPPLHSNHRESPTNANVKQKTLFAKQSASFWHPGLWVKGDRPREGVSMFAEREVRAQKGCEKSITLRRKLSSVVA